MYRKFREDESETGSAARMRVRNHLISLSRFHTCVGGGELEEEDKLEEEEDELEAGAAPSSN